MAPPTAQHEMPERDSWEYILRKYVLMLATLVATVAYDVGFNPPGGVWQDTDDAAGHLAGEPISRTTSRLRYLVFLYCNAAAFVLSILVIVLFLLLSIQIVEKHVWIRLKPLRVLMVLDLLSFMAAFAAGTCRDMLTTVYTSVLMAAAVLTYLTVQAVLWRRPQSPLSADNLDIDEQFCKMLMLLSTFAVSITYVAGLNSPGGFWDNTEGSHRAGDPILNAGHHKARLAIFFVCDTTAFVASLLIIMLLLGGRKQLHERTVVRSREMFGCILLALVGLVGAYATGSCREAVPTAYVLLVISVSLVCTFLVQSHRLRRLFPNIHITSRLSIEMAVSTSSATRGSNNMLAIQIYQSRSLLLLLATFATAITYQAGLAPPGGAWQDNRDGHIAGDPILLTMNATRYKTFLYCNSFAFAASLVTIIVVMMKLKPMLHMVESIMILELFGLIGAYASGACREVTQSIYVMALAGAVLFYVVIHVIFFSLEQAGNGFYFEELKEVEKKRKLLYLLATLSTAMSYQAGLTPPGGFWLRDEEETQHYAGNPVLLYHHPRRYNAFFYCNSVSFMLSVTTMILLVSPVLYRPAIRSYALPLCTVASLFCLMGAYAAGSTQTQHETTSVGIYLLVALAFLILLVLLLTSLVRDYQLRKGTTRLTTADEGEHMTSEQGIATTKRQSAQRKYLMLLGILVAGVTYQAGIDPPGGLWQSGDGGHHDAGSPVMPDTIPRRRQRYLVFFYSNSTSFAVSIVIIVLLLLQWSLNSKRPLHIKKVTKIFPLNFMALLVAYAAGSSRDWKSSVFVVALTMPVLIYITVKGMTRLCTVIALLIRQGSSLQPVSVLVDLE